MKIENPQYWKEEDSNKNLGVSANIDGVKTQVPLVEGNRHYDEIMEQVKEGTLTIKDAD